MNIVMISGKKRSGKDYATAELMKMTNCTRVAFADPLKEIMATTLGLTVEDVNQLKDTPTSTMRFKLQRLGDALKEQFGQDVFVELATSKMANVQNVVISDLRYLRELEGVKRAFPLANITTVRIEALSTAHDTHSSETELEDYKMDFTIDNSAKDHNTMVTALKKIYPQLFKN